MQSNPLLSILKEGSRQAESNLKFLHILKDPCADLADAKPADIPNMLPKILNLIRMIWVNSEFYKTRERLTGLLRKVMIPQLYFHLCRPNQYLLMYAEQ